MATKSRLPSAVLALGAVSLLTDLSSEMIYPLLPAFLVTLGAGGQMIGLIDGLADTTAAFLKLLSGSWSDRLGRRKPLVVAGYGLATLARPLVALAMAPWHVLVIRQVDRVGKGIRSSPRDAIIAAVTPPDRRGAAYGFHRAMDHAGALLGPLVAYALAGWLLLGHRTIFALAAIPGVLAFLVLVLVVREPAEPPVPRPAEGGTRAPLPRRFWIYLGCVALFTLANGSDLFLLMRAVDLGIAPSLMPLLWAFLHAGRSLLSTPLSGLSDRFGRRNVILAGWVVFALSYGGFAVAREPWHIWALLAVYAAYNAFTEGAEKALVADLAPADGRGRAFGAFHFVQGICLLPASLGFGVIWDHVGHGTAFVVSASLSLVAAVALRVLL